jgi:hypothetical protein
MTKEYNIRKRMSQEDNLVEMLTAAGDDQASIVAFATQKGFIRFDMDTMKPATPRGRQSLTTPANTQDELTERMRIAELAKQEALNKRDAARLECEAMELLRKKAEEEEKKDAAMRRISLATKPHRLLATPPRTLASPAPLAQSPVLDDASPNRSEAIMQALAERASRLGKTVEPQSAVGHGPPSAMASFSSTGQASPMPVAKGSSIATSQQASTAAKRPLSTISSTNPSSKSPESPSKLARTDEAPEEHSEQEHNSAEPVEEDEEDQTGAAVADHEEQDAAEDAHDSEVLPVEEEIAPTEEQEETK